MRSNLGPSKNQGVRDYHVVPRFAGLLAQGNGSELVGRHEAFQFGAPSTSPFSRLSVLAITVSSSEKLKGLEI